MYYKYKVKNIAKIDSVSTLKKIICTVLSIDFLGHTGTNPIKNRIYYIPYWY